MSESRSNDTGQISVAELLARNGQKVGTRSGGRRRRGASGGISVAELTGEIPVTRAADDPPKRAAEDSDAPVEPASENRDAGTKTAPATPKTAVAPKPVASSPKKAASSQPSAVEKTTVTPKVSPAATAKVSVTKAPVKPSAATAKAPVISKPATPRGTGDEDAAERTTVTPRIAKADDTAKVEAAPPKIESPTEIIRPEALPRRARAHLDAVASTGVPVVEAPKRAADTVEPRLLTGPASDLRGTGTDTDETDPTGDALADAATSDEDADSTSGKPAKAGKSAKAGKPAKAAKAGKSGKRAERTEADAERTSDDDGQGSSLKQWALVIGESAAAILVGGLLFKGFERLWDMMPWVAFALALLVIVGLVALVRILRRTDDITSQLIALAVGAFVAFGPLLFLLPNG